MVTHLRVVVTHLGIFPTIFGMCCYLECIALRLKSNQYSFLVELVDEYAVLPTSLNCREFTKEISVNTRLTS